MTVSTAASVGDATIGSPATAGSRTRQKRRRLFSIGSLRFRLSRARIMDSLMDGISWAVEGVVYLIGPLLIILALSLISLLTFSFVTILLPMMKSKHEGSSVLYLYLGLHCSWVLFVLVNILFNYFYCVMTRHVGPHYDKLVRELAQATDMVYPETPAQLEQYRRDFEDRMIFRMRRRKAREEEKKAAPPAQDVMNGMTQRKVAPPPPAPKAAAQKASPKVAPVRRWMLMGPLEWGYCGNTKQPKPPRSHYDHVTKKLILNLDHYCPWMFNSIGYFNYRYFVNFMFYIFAGMVYGAIITLEPFLLSNSSAFRQQHQLERRQGHKPDRLQPMLPYGDERMLVTLSFMMSLAVGVAILLLGGFHVYLTLTGQTTIEFHANFAHKKRARQQGQKWKNPYSLGSARANFEQVFGRRRPWFLALLPSSREPDFLPVPIPGHPGRVHAAASKKEQEMEQFEDGEQGDVLV